MRGSIRGLPRTCRGVAKPVRFRHSPATVNHRLRARGSPVAGPAVDALPSRERAGNDATVRLIQPLSSRCRSEGFLRVPRPRSHPALEPDVSTFHPVPVQPRRDWSRPDRRPIAPGAPSSRSPSSPSSSAPAARAATPRPTTPPDATGSLVPRRDRDAAPVDGRPDAGLPRDAHRRRGHATSPSPPSRPAIVSLTPATTEIAVRPRRRRPGRRQGRGLHALPARGRRRSPTSAKFGEVDVEKIVALGAGPRHRRRQQLQPARQDRPAPQARRAGPRRSTPRTSPGCSRDIELTGAAVGRASMAGGSDRLDAGRIRPGGGGHGRPAATARVLRARCHARRSTPRPTTRSSPR